MINNGSIPHVSNLCMEESSFYISNSSCFRLPICLLPVAMDFMNSVRHRAAASLTVLLSYVMRKLL